ncbi:YqaA family protein [Bryobacter aggregatus]|uniref:YqaA family protein n=1 Tax=Bryobacter aggregatus TaxID=360054 RepID=UPI0004E1561E|nr:VTT domain-containing protein [Bryobacter aggregatus]
MKAFLAWLVTLGPFGLFLIATLDSTGIPIPGVVDTLLVVIANRTPALGYFCAFLATVGSLIGSMILFMIARKGGQRYLEEATSGERGRKFRRWFSHYGLITVFVPSLSVIPMPLKAFVACSGVLGIRPLYFALAILAGRIPRYFFLAWLGQEMGDHAGEWIKAHTLHFGLGLAALGLVLLMLVRLGNKESEVIDTGSPSASASR